MFLRKALTFMALIVFLFASAGPAIAQVKSSGGSGKAQEPQVDKDKEAMEAKASFRKELAANYGTKLRNRGIDAKVRVEGEINEILVIEWKNFNKDVARKWMRDSELTSLAIAAGFERVELSDGETAWMFTP